MDSIAGERERRSLLPLLMRPVTMLDVLLGKWLAVAVFSVAGLARNVLGFALLLRRVPPWHIALCLLLPALPRLRVHWCRRPGWLDRATGIIGNSWVQARE